MKIAVIVAMEKEMNSLTALLTDKNEVTSGGFRYVTGRMGDKTLILHQCGIGKVNAAIGASEIIRTYQPDFLISSGCAGGLDPQLRVMDVVVSTSVVYHDMFIGEAGEGVDIVNPYPSDPFLLERARTLTPATPTKIHLGQICTGDQFLTERPKLEAIKAAHPDGLAVDMESCAIAQTCKLYGVPFISFRIISDTIGSDFHVEEYQNFWAEMADHSFDVVRNFIQLI